MKRKTFLLISLSIILPGLLGIVIADENQPSAKENGAAPANRMVESARPADEKAIRDAAGALAAAFEKGDAAAVAQFWTPEGEYCDEGSAPVRGRVALTKAYTDFFAKRPNVKVDAKTESVRFLGQDTAIEEGRFSVQPQNSPAQASRYSSLYVRQNGQWLIATMKEWSAEAIRGRLHDLAWLIGNWETETAVGKVHSSYEWAENKKFIICKYTIAVAKGDTPVQRSGMQIIGLDPSSGQVRAWTFDADGGIGESFWTKDDDRWAIRSSGVVGDGADTSALNLLTPKGADSFTWRSVQRLQNGETLPDLGPIKVNRVTVAGKP